MGDTKNSHGDEQCFLKEADGMQKYTKGVIISFMINLTRVRDIRVDHCR